MHTDNQINSINNPKAYVINVIEEFDYSTQSDEYNEEFKTWRMKKSNRFSYNYLHNMKERIFVDGQGFISSSAAEVEHDILFRVLTVLGNLFITFIFIEKVFEKFLIEILDIAGFNIHNSFISGSVYGGKSEVLVMTVVINVLKYFIPVAIMHRRFKMPNRVRYPSRKCDLSAWFYATSISFIVAVVSSISHAYSYQTKELYNYFNNSTIDFSFFSEYELVVYLFFDIIVMSIMNELMFHGEAFHVLRQFGDLFAVIFSAVFSTLIIGNFRLMPGNFLVSMISGIVLLRTGNISMSIYVQMLNKLYLLGLIILESSNNEYMFMTRSTYMSVVFAIGVIIFLVVKAVDQRENVLKANLRTYLPTLNKIETVFRCLPLVGVIIACFFASIWNIMT